MLLRKSVCLVLCLIACAAGAATTTAKKQSAIQMGTTVRTRVAPSGVYDQACYDAYYGCMDQFCIIDNVSGGSCECSDENSKYEERLNAIRDNLAEAERIATEEVERVQAGANADIIFSGTREYDEKGNVASAQQEKQKKRESLLAMFNTSYDDEDVFDDEFDSITAKTGNALFSAAHNLCVSQIDDSCDKDITFLKSMYSRQILSDCKALENSISTKESEARQALLSAQAAVRGALRDSLASANKYDRGQCMVEYKKCMQTADACGSNWENCVFTIAAENAQEKAKSTKNTKIKKTDVYDITASTMEILESKRYICENVLDSCVAVRDMVWTDFLREAAPTIRLAELQAESKKRQSCLSDISKCIQTACKDDIAGKGVATMDACLARPDMARSFCKVEIDPCERMEPQIWSYVTDKLAAMRVDACTTEVKDCFTDDTRCGPDFSNCIGMDYNYIHNICPIDKLVVCKQANPKFSMDDLDSMLMGLYLNIDNSMLDNCQNIIDRKMTEVCGSTTDCNRFAADDTMGTGSIRSQKIGDLYRVTGMISFGSIKIGDTSGKTVDGNGVLAPGQIGVADYIENVRANNANVSDDSIISSIEAELNNISGTINRTIEMIEQDPEIQYCVNGRDLSQITGRSGETTTARFPNLLNSVKTQIAVAALRKAQDNYNAKVTEEIANATKNASADVAQYMCQKIAESGNVSNMASIAPSTPLTPPYAISYDVANGLQNIELLNGGVGVSQLANSSYDNSGYLGGNSGNLGGVTKEVTSVFDRENRICHVCTTTATQSCETTGSESWFHNSRNTSCETESDGPNCEDIPM
ncbi:MAG: hypothetical protein KBS86_01080 [Proteobacteria bacterium]|nr:hypothetical protein [Candidatus Enterousia scatequi]